MGILWVVTESSFTERRHILLCRHLPTSARPGSFVRTCLLSDLGSNPLTDGQLGEVLLAVLKEVPNIDALDVAYLGQPVDLEGTRVATPMGCRLGAGAPPCEFQLQLYDSQSQPVKVGGLKPMITFGADCDTSWDTCCGGYTVIARRNCRLMSPLPMADGGDGTYTAEIPLSWAPSNTSTQLVVGFFDESRGRPVEFFPSYVSPWAWLLHCFHSDSNNNMLTHPARRQDGSGVHVFDRAADNGDSTAESLRTVAYGPVSCAPTSHTVPDPETGATCECMENFVPDPAAVLGSENATLSCHMTCSDSTTGAACDHCPAGRYADSTGYDAIAGTPGSTRCRRCNNWAICPGGLFADATSQPCGNGTQPDEETGLQCEDCPAGRVTPGLSLCEPCGSHTIPNMYNTRCKCAQDFVPDSPLGDSGKILGCHLICEGEITGTACDQCPSGRHAQRNPIRRLGYECRICDPWAICPGGLFDTATSTPCERGTQPDTATALICEDCPAGRATPGSRLCESCGPNQEPDKKGSECICVFGHYNSSLFGKRKVQCVAQDLRSDAEMAEKECVPCTANDACVECAAVMRTSPDWQALNDSRWNVFSCPLKGACIGPTADDPDQRSGCATGYTGTLCGVCAENYDIIGSTCEECTKTGTTNSVFVFASVFLLLAILSWLVNWRLAKIHKRVGVGELDTATTDNPIPRSSNQEVLDMRSSVSSVRQSMRQTLSREMSVVGITKNREKAGTLARVLYQPGRIMIGFVQVVHHM